MPSAAALRLTIERSLERRFPAALTPAPRVVREMAATGIAAVDAHLGGGLPVGAISELTGPASSGRTSLALAFLARRTAEGRACAWVDANDAFDPESAAASGVILPRLLWVRCRNAAAPAPAGKISSTNSSSAKVWTRLDQALRATDLLLQAGGFASLVLDLGQIAREQGNRIPLATWFRFRQAADRARCSLVVLGRASYAQSAAAMVLACQPSRTLAAGETALRGFEFQIERRRERFAPLEIHPREQKPAITEIASRWGGKPPVSTCIAAWTADAAWDVDRAQERRA
jgi:hypothetical protein